MKGKWRVMVHDLLKDLQVLLDERAFHSRSLQALDSRISAIQRMLKKPPIEDAIIDGRPKGRPVSQKLIDPLQYYLEDGKRKARVEDAARWLLRHHLATSIDFEDVLTDISRSAKMSRGYLKIIDGVLIMKPGRKSSRQGRHRFSNIPRD